ncbi:MAG: chorismate-binding protein, partial [Rhodocyclaceae bacterium]|nr:chorismate-binding protein [Rhodocyclaceae bacterium]
MPQPLSTAPELAGPGFYLSHAQGAELYAGYGIAAEWQAEGPGRLAILRRIASAWSKDWLQIDPDETGLLAHGLLGFAATPQNQAGDALPNALLWLPELALIRRQGRSALILTAPYPIAPLALWQRWEPWLERLATRLSRVDERSEIHHDNSLGKLDQGGEIQRDLSQPDLADWSRLVSLALDAIGRGQMEKVVICRRQRLRGRRPFDLERLRWVLGELFPACQVIHIRRDSDLIAATPERLFSQRGDRVEADAIAGTACRTGDQMRDAAMRRRLLACPKNRHEHQVVVDAVRAALAPCCRHLEAPKGPRILALSNAYHLQSQVRGLLHPGVDAFALAECLH